MSPNDRVFSWRRGILVAGLSLLATAAALEIAVRVLVYRAPDVITSSPEIFYFDRKAPLRYGPHGDLVPGETLWMVGRWRPYRVSVNSDGLRAAAELGTAGILAVGDSFTFGVYVQDEDTWPAQLASELLRLRPDRSMRVGNAGIPGYGIVQELEYLREKGLGLRPAVVVLAFNPNDVDVDLRPERLAQFRRPRDESMLRSILRHSAAAVHANSLGVAWSRRQLLAAATRDAESHARATAPDYDAYAAHFRELVAMLAEAKVRLVVVAFPRVEQLVSDACDDRPQRFVEALTRGLRVPFLDLMTEFKRHRVEDLYLLDYDPRGPLETGPCFSERKRFVGNTHPSRFGYGVAARTIAAWLGSQGVL